MRMGRDGEAIAAFSKSLQLDPTYPGAHMRLGELYRRQRNRGNARKHLRAELLLRPSDPQVLLDLANLLMDNGQSRAAIACLKRMISTDPGSASGWQNLAVAQFMRGLYEDGIASSLHALEQEPENLPTLFNLALANEHLSRYEEALHWVGRGLALEPTDLSFQKLEFRVRVLKILRPIRSAAAKLMFWKR
jgi:tetratricopeptide (TPR) repeat protein